MSEFHFKQPISNRRVLRNNSKINATSSNKNGEFDIPNIPSNFNAQYPQLNEISAVQCLKPISDKFEVINKLKLIPIEEVQQISAEFIQKLDSLCMEKITEQLLQPNSNRALSVISDNGSALHTLISQGTINYQPSTRSCICQPSTCGSEIRYSAREDIPVNELHSRPPSEQRPQNKRKPAAKKAAPSVTNSIISEASAASQGGRKNSQKTAPRATARSQSIPARTSRAKTSRSDSIDSTTTENISVESPKPRSRSVARTRTKARVPRTQTIPRTPDPCSSIVDENDIVAALKNDTVVINRIKKTKSTTELTKRKRDDSTFQARKKRAVEGPLKKNDNEDTFGDISAVVSDSTRMDDSPGNALINLTNTSATKILRRTHFLSPFSNRRSNGGVSAISTPLPKTISKPLVHKRQKKPDVLSESKTKTSRPIAKRISKNNIFNLDDSQGSEYISN